jgi:hypothetical protein
MTSYRVLLDVGGRRGKGRSVSYYNSCFTSKEIVLVEQNIFLIARTINCFWWDDDDI